MVNSKFQKAKGRRQKALVKLPNVFAHCSLLTAHCQPPTAHCSLPTAHCPPPTAHCSLPTANCSHLFLCRFFSRRRDAALELLANELDQIIDLLLRKFAFECGHTVAALDNLFSEV